MNYEVVSDGKTVWVNGSDGCCLGRFSKQGIDVHKDAAAQALGSHCLDCKPGPTDGADWKRFCDSMMAHYGCVVAERHKPQFLKREMQ